MIACYIEYRHPLGSYGSLTRIYKGSGNYKMLKDRLKEILPAAQYLLIYRDLEAAMTIETNTCVIGIVFDSEEDCNLFRLSSMHEFNVIIAEDFII